MAKESLIQEAEEVVNPTIMLGEHEFTLTIGTKELQAISSQGLLTKENKDFYGDSLAIVILGIGNRQSKPIVSDWFEDAVTSKTLKYEGMPCKSLAIFYTYLLNFIATKAQLLGFI